MVIFKEQRKELITVMDIQLIHCLFNLILLALIIVAGKINKIVVLALTQRNLPTSSLFNAKIKIDPMLLCCDWSVPGGK